METAVCEQAGHTKKQVLVSPSSKLSQTWWFYIAGSFGLAHPLLSFHIDF